MTTQLTRFWLPLALALTLVAISPVQSLVTTADISLAVQSVEVDQYMVGSIDALLARALLSAEREDLVRAIASGPASIQRHCALLDLELRAGHREAAHRLVDQLIASHEFAGSPIPSIVISFIINHNRSQGLNDTALATKLYRRFPDPELPELRDILVSISETEGDLAAAHLLAGIPYTEQVSTAVGWWRQGVEKRGHVEIVARDLDAAGRADLAKAAKGQPVAPEKPPVRHTQRLGATIPQVQGVGPPAPTDPDTADYWLAEADEAVRQGDAAAAESAFVRALELAPVPGREGHGKVEPVRLRVLQDYRRFLIQQDRPDEAVQLLRQEVADAGLNTASGRLALRTLCQWGGAYAGAAIRPGDELMWEALAGSEKWDNEETRCLDRLAGKLAGYPEPKGTPAPPWTAAYAALERAEKMCEGAHTSRTLVVGRLWLEYHRPERALLLLRQALSPVEDPDEAASVRRDLFTGYLNAGLPSEAEQLLPALLDHQPDEAVACYGRLAIAWARAGSKTEAIESWRRAANFDATQLHAIRDLVEAGLRPELEDFYGNWQQADPASWVPPMALRLLDADMETLVSVVEAN